MILYSSNKELHDVFEESILDSLSNNDRNGDRQECWGFHTATVMKHPDLGSQARYRPIKCLSVDKSKYHSPREYNGTRCYMAVLQELAVGVCNREARSTPSLGASCAPEADH